MADQNRLKEVFNLYDRDHDGLVHRNELGKLLRAIGQNPTEREIFDLNKALAADNNGNMNLDAFKVVANQFVCIPPRCLSQRSLTRLLFLFF